MPHTRILIAEDTEFFRTMLRDSLTEKGLEVVTAKDGVEAMEIISCEHASLGLLLLDLVMPNKNGEQVLRELKANQETKHLPVLVLTGLKLPPEKRALLRSLGAAGFLAKPASADKVLSRVLQILEERNSTDRASSKGVDVNILVEFKTKYGMFSAYCYRLWTEWIDLRTIRPLPIGSSSMISFILPGSQDKVQLRGKVVEMRPQGINCPSDKPPGMRVRFLSPDAGQMVKITEFLKTKIHC